MTKENFQLKGADVYSYTAADGVYAKCIFNGTGGQTGNLTWTAGKYYYNDGWYTRAELEGGDLPEQPKDTVFFVNQNNWKKVYIWGWDGISVNAGWPGGEMTKADYQLKDADVYYYTVSQGATGKCLFNCGGDQCKTGDLTWTAGMYYYDGGWRTRAELEGGGEMLPAVTLMGEMNNWGGTAMTASDDKLTASATVTLDVKTYGFKIVVGSTWLTDPNFGTMNRANCTGWVFENKEGKDSNTKITADVAGDYTFTWTYANNSLSVTYPMDGPTSISSTEAEVVTTKVIRDGQVLIIRDGVVYNMMGQAIR